MLVKRCESSQSESVAMQCMLSTTYILHLSHTRPTHNAKNDVDYVPTQVRDTTLAQGPNYTMSDLCLGFALGTSLIPPPGRSASLAFSDASKLSVDSLFHKLMLSSRSSSRSPRG